MVLYTKKWCNQAMKSIFVYVPGTEEIGEITEAGPFGRGDIDLDPNGLAVAIHIGLRMKEIKGQGPDQPEGERGFVLACSRYSSATSTIRMARRLARISGSSLLSTQVLEGFDEASFDFDDGVAEAVMKSVKDYHDALRMVQDVVPEGGTAFVVSHERITTLASMALFDIDDLPKLSSPLVAGSETLFEFSDAAKKPSLAYLGLPTDVADATPDQALWYPGKSKPTQ